MSVYIFPVLILPPRYFKDAELNYVFIFEQEEHKKTTLITEINFIHFELYQNIQTYG